MSERDPTGPALGDQHGVAVEDLQRLWAPWRHGYVADGTGAEGCPFCVLPARDDDRASLIVHRGEHVFVVLNAYPYNPGHVMVVPYEHTDDVTGLADDVAAELWDVGRRTVAALRHGLGAGGVNLGMNLWATGGAGIPDHVHLHAVPRWGGDTNFMSVVGATRVLPVALQEVYPRLRDAIVDAGGRP